MNEVFTEAAEIAEKKRNWIHHRDTESTEKNEDRREGFFYPIGSRPIACLCRTVGTSVKVYKMPVNRYVLDRRCP